MRCPRDKGQLDGCFYEDDIAVDECQECHGIWLDAGELEKVQESMEHDHSGELKNIPDFAIRAYRMAKAKRESELECPICGRPMDKNEYGYCSQIIIDVCSVCQGIWLDKGELEALEVFFERARAETREIRRGFFGSLAELFRR